MSRVKKGLSLFEKTKEAGRKAAKATAETAKGAAIRAGSPGSGTKVVKGTTTRNLGKGFGLQQTGPGKGTRAATKAQRSKVARSGAKRIAGTGAAVGVGVGLTKGERKQTEKKKDQPKAKKFNVGVSKGGVPFNEAFKHFRDKGQKQFTWNGKKYTTELDTEKAKRLASKKKRVGPIRKFLLGEDGKFGGKRGAIDFLPGKSRPGRQGGSPTSPASAKGRKIVSKAGGGMMKSKMASKGGARGGKRVPPGMMGGGMMKSKMSAKSGAKGGKKMAPGMKVGGMANKKFPDLTGDGKVTQKDILKGRGVPGFSEGGGAKKSKGYAKGGKVMKSKMATKGGAPKKKTTRRSKPRGVGAALRGYGKALR